MVVKVSLALKIRGGKKTKKKVSLYIGYLQEIKPHNSYIKFTHIHTLNKFSYFVWVAYYQLVYFMLVHPYWYMFETRFHFTYLHPS